MSSDSQRSLPLSEDLRAALDSLGNEEPPDEREFVARLHRRLVAAGAPPAPGWLDRLTDRVCDRLFDRQIDRQIDRWHSGCLELWQNASQKRSLLTGAVLGALAMATAFLMMSGGHALRDGAPATGPDDEAADVDSPGMNSTDRKSQRAVGDRRLTRDRLGEDIGAERPERLRAHDPVPRQGR